MQDMVHLDAISSKLEEIDITEKGKKYCSFVFVMLMLIRNHTF